MNHPDVYLTISGTKQKVYDDISEIHLNEGKQLKAKFLSQQLVENYSPKKQRTNWKQLFLHSFLTNRVREKIRITVPCHAVHSLHHLLKRCCSNEWFSWDTRYMSYTDLCTYLLYVSSSGKEFDDQMLVGIISTG